MAESQHLNGDDQQTSAESPPEPSTSTQKDDDSINGGLFLGVLLRPEQIDNNIEQMYADMALLLGFQPVTGYWTSDTFKLSACREILLKVHRVEADMKTRVQPEQPTTTEASAAKQTVGTEIPSPTEYPMPKRVQQLKQPPSQFAEMMNRQQRGRPEAQIRSGATAERMVPAQHRMARGQEATFWRWMQHDSRPTKMPAHQQQGTPRECHGVQRSGNQISREVQPKIVYRNTTGGRDAATTSRARTNVHRHGRVFSSHRRGPHAVDMRPHPVQQQSAPREQQKDHAQGRVCEMDAYARATHLSGDCGRYHQQETVRSEIREIDEIMRRTQQQRPPRILSKFCRICLQQGHQQMTCPKVRVHEVRHAASTCKEMLQMLTMTHLDDDVEMCEEELPSVENPHMQQDAQDVMLEQQLETPALYAYDNAADDSLTHASAARLISDAVERMMSQRQTSSDNTDTTSATNHDAA